MRLTTQQKKELPIDIDIYWYSLETTPQELAQEVEDLKEFYDIVIVPELEDK